MNRLAVVVVLGACGGGGGAAIDAPSVAIDARVVDGKPSDAPHAFPLARTHTLYVAIDGVTVTPGSGPDSVSEDAVANTTMIATAPAALGPWLAGDPDRAAKVGILVDQIQSVIAPYNITVVTTRPATGPYEMVVVTDDPATKLASSLQLISAISASACSRQASGIGFVFPTALSDVGTRRTDFVQYQAIEMMGLANGVPLSSVAGDCMCGSNSDTHCQDMLDSLCTIGGAHTPLAGTTICDDFDATMDEAAVFLAVFGPH